MTATRKPTRARHTSSGHFVAMVPWLGLSRGFCLGNCSQGKDVVLSVLDLPRLITDTDLDSPAKAVGAYSNNQAVLFELDLDLRLAKPQGEREAIQPLIRLRAEAQYAILDLGPHVAPLDQVQRSGHHPHVDAFFCGAALNIADVALQRGCELIPRALRVQIGQDGSVHDETQRRAVRGPGLVVGDVLTGSVGRVLVAKSVEDPT